MAKVYCRRFDPADAERSYGRQGSPSLLHTLERAAIIGAKLTIHSTIGKGNVVRLPVPLARRGERDL